MKKNRRIFIVPVFLIIIVFGYFFWPQSFKAGNEEQVNIRIDKQIEGTSCYYALTEQEVNELVKILEKSRFYHGVSRPSRMFADKTISVMVNGSLSPIITIYYDTNKTYVFANISTELFLNVYYRISNKEEIKDYIEDIVNTKLTEFEKIPGN